jgi:hypothetical protein
MCALHQYQSVFTVGFLSVILSLLQLLSLVLCSQLLLILLDAALGFRLCLVLAPCGRVLYSSGWGVCFVLSWLLFVALAELRGWGVIRWFR